MGWAITLAILYVPVLYRMNRRIARLEQEIEILKKEG